MDGESLLNTLDTIQRANWEINDPEEEVHIVQSTVTVVRHKRKREISSQVQDWQNGVSDTPKKIRQET